LESVEKSLGALDVDEVAGESVDDLGQRKLDGETILECGERDNMAAFHQAFAADHTAAIETVSLVEAAVEVAEDRGLECDGFALMAIRLDMTTECDLHVRLLAPRGVPPRVTLWVKLLVTVTCVAGQKLYIRF
jgi:hypothetical protein